MAIMIPERPREFTPASQEGMMFDALSLLSDDYYIFHSVRISMVTKSIIEENETDFIIFNKQLGIICLEAKAGHVHYERGMWLYSNDTPMHNGGPFNQAASNKYKLMDYISNSSLRIILRRCKFLHAVWFPTLSDAELKQLTFPTEGNQAKILVLTKEALLDPQIYIERIYSIELENRIKTDLSEIDSKKLVCDIFCPQFNVFPNATYEYDLKKMVFHRMLKEQSSILNFLQEQRTASINGAAGTGKTLIAIEKAQRHAFQEEKVLFLCYNNKLVEYLAEKYRNEYIDFYTIDAYVCKLAVSSVIDYGKAKEKLLDYYVSGSFPYNHVIIDEGQDFGNDNIEDADIVHCILKIITDQTERGSFYVFFDKLQLVQSKKMPKFIDELDCKITLYKNCRNTENIAISSLSPITQRQPALFEGAIKGTPTRLHFCNNLDAIIASIDLAIEVLHGEGISDIVILTCKTVKDSAIKNIVGENEKYKGKYLFTTCRKYKGLEADSIILIDVESSTFEEQNVLLYYVGTSRARLKLDIITTLTDDECVNVLKEAFSQTEKIRNPKLQLAKSLHALASNC